MKNLRQTLKIAYDWVNQRTYGFARILRIALLNYGDANAAQAAAGMAYYAFFSLFPLLLFLIVGTSYILENEFAYQYITNNILRLLPTAQKMIDANLQQVLNSRGAVGLLGVIAFLWSSSSFFSLLAKNINSANPKSGKRNFLEDRAIALGMIGLLTLLLALSFLSNTLTGLLSKLDIFYWGDKSLNETIIWRYFLKIIPFAFTLVLLIALYRYIPKKKVRWIGVNIAALSMAVLWQLVTRIFTWLLGEGLLNYELVYGSLGTVAALLFWIYLISQITLFGAYLSASIDNNLTKDHR